MKLSKFFGIVKVGMAAVTGLASLKSFIDAYNYHYNPTKFNDPGYTDGYLNRMFEKASLCIGVLCIPLTVSLYKVGAYLEKEAYNAETSKEQKIKLLSNLLKESLKPVAAAGADAKQTSELQKIQHALSAQIAINKSAGINTNALESVNLHLLQFGSDIQSKRTQLEQDNAISECATAISKVFC